MDETTKQLLSQIQQTARGARRNARINYWIAYVLTFLSIAGSISATALISTSNATGGASLAALAAALPAAVFAFNSKFQFERKAAWHWRRVKLVQGLARALQFENQEAAVISRAFSRIDGELDQEWVGLGNRGEDEPAEPKAQQ